MDDFESRLVTAIHDNTEALAREVLEMSEYAVFESGTDDQLSEVMTRAEARQWADDAYEAGETRVLAIRLA